MNLKIFLPLFYLFFYSLISLSISIDEKSTLNKLTRAIDDLGFKILQKLELSEQEKVDFPKGNICISPLGINAGLLMLMAGAKGATYYEIYQTLGLQKTSLNVNQLLGYYQQLFTLAQSHPTINISHLLTYESENPPNQDYSNQILSHFNSFLFDENFSIHKASEDINHWIRDHTSGQLQKLIQKDFDTKTGLLLVNSLLLGSQWKNLKPISVHKGYFFYPDSSGIFNFIEFETTQLNYANFTDGQMVEIPLIDKTNNLSLYLFLPPQNYGQFIVISSNFTGENLEERISKLKPSQVAISIPKFKFNTSQSLGPTLQELGIKTAFDPNEADFSLINSNNQLNLEDLFVAGKIDFNETGTIIAAVDGEEMPIEDSFQVDEVEEEKESKKIESFWVNHPFMFLVRDNGNNLTLSSGIVSIPIGYDPNN